VYLIADPDRAPAIVGGAAARGIQIHGVAASLADIVASGLVFSPSVGGDIGA
jgi:hypothetical protein